MILQLQAHVHFLVKFGGLTLRYAILSNLKALFSTLLITRTPLLKGIFGEVEHDFSEGLSTSVISKLIRSDQKSSWFQITCNSD